MLILDLTKCLAVKFHVWNSVPIKCILSFTIFAAQVIALIAVQMRDQLRVVVPVGNMILQSGGDLVLPRPSAVSAAHRLAAALIRGRGFGDGRQAGPGGDSDAVTHGSNKYLQGTVPSVPRDNY